MDTSELAIHVTNLCKEFKLYDHPSDMFREILTGKVHHRSFYALRDVSFSVKRGHVVGIMGLNGAGKSTLLKIISGTLDKSSGEVEVKGRISSILELGTGFNGEYTGRENIYLGGLMMGMSSDEIKAKEDWIIAFSELGDFIDQPFKTYSSGMQARLTFSTAVCINPDILIIDEALSVGDARFQKKSYNQIRKFREAGNTILFVSHDTNSIVEICDEAMILNHGVITHYGSAKDIAKEYWKLVFVEEQPKPAPVLSYAGSVPENIQVYNGDSSSIVTFDNESDIVQSQPAQHFLGYRAGDRIVGEMIDISILNEKGEKTTLIQSGDKCTVNLKAKFHKKCSDVSFGFSIANQKGAVLYATTSRDQGITIPTTEKDQIINLQFNFIMLLTNHDFLLSAGIATFVNGDQHVIDGVIDAVHLVIPRIIGIQHASILNLAPSVTYTTE